MNQQAAISVINFLTGIVYLNLQYITQTKRHGAMYMGLSYLDFGKITQHNAVGFSLRAMIQIKTFQFDNVGATYHVTSTSNHFSMSICLQKNI